MTFKVQSIVVSLANDFLLNILSGLNQIKISRLLTILVDVTQHKGPLHDNWISIFDHLQARVLIIGPKQVSWIQKIENQDRDKNRIGRDLLTHRRTQPFIVQDTTQTSYLSPKYSLWLWIFFIFYYKSLHLSFKRDVSHNNTILSMIVTFI